MKKIPHISLTQIPNSMRKIILGLIFSLAILGLNAQDKKCACCTESHREFNFWIGDWTVYDVIGNINEEGKQLQEAFRGIYKKNVKTEKN